MATLSRKDILHVAKLAHLKIADADIPVRLKEFNDILTYIEKLSQLDTKGIEPTSQVSSQNEKTIGTPMMPDEPMPEKSLTPDAAFQNAPDKQDHFFKVPRMIGEEN